MRLHNILAVPASVIIAHDDSEFVETTVKALRLAGLDVLGFASSMSALEALEAAQRVEVLITRVRFPEGQQNGISLAMMARMKRPAIKVLFVAAPDTQEHTEGVGQFLPASVTASEIAETVV
jgi:DNA-binding NtrC family response regulator